MKNKNFTKIIISIFVFISIFSFFNQTKKVEAVVQTMDIGTPTISQGFNGKWKWKFNIVTTYVPDNTTITVETNELIKVLPIKTTTVVNNSSVYDTGDTLISGTPYVIKFTLNTNPSITKTYNNTPGSTSGNLLPQITTFSPTEGKVGDIVTITGNNFTGTKNIFFGLTNADTSSATISNSEIKIAVPTGASDGKITIRNNAGEKVSSTVFKVKTDPTDINGDDANTTSDEYTLLAPIGTFTKAPSDIGLYFNLIFKIAIGFCAVLAVIMIVIGGIQYMGDESIFGKTEAKKSIYSAILGLIIALGSYALLNTINPDLLGKSGVKINQVSAEIEEPPMLQESIDIPSPGTAINECQEGIEQINTQNGTTMHLCKNISIKVKNGINNATTSNIKLSGAAFRSRADQVRLRTTNHCPDVYNSPSSDCTPPTAKPGASLHESGKAIDFKCDGQTIRAKDNKCFLWLTANAGSMGLKNFPKEPWHWSTTGH